MAGAAADNWYTDGPTTSFTLVAIRRPGGGASPHTRVPGKARFPSGVDAGDVRARAALQRI